MEAFAFGLFYKATRPKTQRGRPRCPTFEKYHPPDENKMRINPLTAPKRCPVTFRHRPCKAQIKNPIESHAIFLLYEIWRRGVALSMRSGLRRRRMREPAKRATMSPDGVPRSMERATPLRQIPVLQRAKKKLGSPSFSYLNVRSAFDFF